jgi:hypothetical protein
MVDCSTNGNGTTPPNPPPLQVLPSAPSGFTSGDGMHSASSSDGLFKHYIPPTTARMRDAVSFKGCNNPAAATLVNGSIAVWCFKPVAPSRLCTYQVWVADGLNKPFRLLDADGKGHVTIDWPAEILAASGGTIFTDGPTLFIDKRGNWHVLSHNGAGLAPCGLQNATGVAFRDGNPEPIGCGVHFYSADDWHWKLSPVAAYNASVSFADGRPSANLFRQRPKVVQDPDSQELTHLFTGVMHHTQPYERRAGSGDSTHGGQRAHQPMLSGRRNDDFSWTMVVPLNRLKADDEHVAAHRGWIYNKRRS